MTNPINPSNYNLLDSETNETLSTDDLHCSYADYAAAIRESLDSDQAEGHVWVNGRKCYAMPV